MTHCTCGKTINYRAKRCRECHFVYSKGKNHPRYGVKLSQNLKNKIIKATKLAMQSIEIKNKLIGRKLTSEQKLNMSQSRIKNKTFTREKNPAWRGGKFIDSYGYRLIRINKKYVKEHRYLLEQHLNRKLLGTEIVHHINGIRTDNCLENLCITNRSQHEHYTLVKILQAKIRELEKKLCC